MTKKQVTLFNQIWTRYQLISSWNHVVFWRLYGCSRFKKKKTPGSFSQNISLPSVVPDGPYGPQISPGQHIACLIPCLSATGETCPAGGAKWLPKDGIFFQSGKNRSEEGLQPEADHIWWHRSPLIGKFLLYRFKTIFIKTTIFIQDTECSFQRISILCLHFHIELQSHHKQNWTLGYKKILQWKITGSPSPIHFFTFLGQGLCPAPALITYCTIYIPHSKFQQKGEQGRQQINWRWDLIDPLFLQHRNTIFFLKTIAAWGKEHQQRTFHDVPQYPREFLRSGSRCSFFWGSLFVLGTQPVVLLAVCSEITPSMGGSGDNMWCQRPTVLYLKCSFSQETKNLRDGHTWKKSRNLVHSQVKYMYPKSQEKRKDLTSKSEIHLINEELWTLELER